MKLNSILRTACLSAAVLMGASFLAPQGDGLVGTAEANGGSCVLIDQYIDENGNVWGVYRCGPGPGNVITVSCDRGTCPTVVQDYRDEQ